MSSAKGSSCLNVEQDIFRYLKPDSPLLWYWNEDSDIFSVFPVVSVKVDATVFPQTADITLKVCFETPPRTRDKQVNALFMMPMKGIVTKATVDINRDTVIFSELIEEAELKCFTNTPNSSPRREEVEAPKWKDIPLYNLEGFFPGVFRLPILNLKSGDKIAVEIHYTETNHYTNSNFRVDIPLAFPARVLPVEPIKISNGKSCGLCSGRKHILSHLGKIPCLCTRCGTDFVPPTLNCIRAGFYHCKMKIINCNADIKPTLSLPAPKHYVDRTGVHIIEYTNPLLPLPPDALSSRFLDRESRTVSQINDEGSIVSRSYVPRRSVPEQKGNPVDTTIADIQVLHGNTEASPAKLRTDPVSPRKTTNPKKDGNVNMHTSVANGAVFPSRDMDVCDADLGNELRDIMPHAGFNNAPESLPLFDATSVFDTDIFPSVTEDALIFRLANDLHVATEEGIVIPENTTALIREIVTEKRNNGGTKRYEQVRETLKSTQLPPLFSRRRSPPNVPSTTSADSDSAPLNLVGNNENPENGDLSPYSDSPESIFSYFTVSSLDKILKTLEEHQTKPTTQSRVHIDANFGPETVESSLDSLQITFLRLELHVRWLVDSTVHPFEKCSFPSLFRNALGKTENPVTISRFNQYPLAGFTPLLNMPIQLTSPAYSDIPEQPAFSPLLPTSFSHQLPPRHNYPQMRTNMSQLSHPYYEPNQSSPELAHQAQKASAEDAQFFAQNQRIAGMHVSGFSASGQHLAIDSTTSLGGPLANYSQHAYFSAHQSFLSQSSIPSTIPSLPLPPTLPPARSETGSDILRPSDQRVMSFDLELFTASATSDMNSPRVHSVHPNLFTMVWPSDVENLRSLAKSFMRTKSRGERLTMLLRHALNVFASHGPCIATNIRVYTSINEEERALKPSSLVIVGSEPLTSHQPAPFDADHTKFKHLRSNSEAFSGDNENSPTNNKLSGSIATENTSRLPAKSSLQLYTHSSADSGTSVANAPAKRVLATRHSFPSSNSTSPLRNTAAFMVSAICQVHNCMMPCLACRHDFPKLLTAHGPRIDFCGPHNNPSPCTICVKLAADNAPLCPTHRHPMPCELCESQPVIDSCGCADCADACNCYCHNKCSCSDNCSFECSTTDFMKAHVQLQFPEKIPVITEDPAKYVPYPFKARMIVTPANVADNASPLKAYNSSGSVGSNTGSSPGQAKPNVRKRDANAIAKPVSYLQEFQWQWRIMQAHTRLVRNVLRDRARSLYDPSLVAPNGDIAGAPLQETLFSLCPHYHAFQSDDDWHTHQKSMCRQCGTHGAGMKMHHTTLARCLGGEVDVIVGQLENENCIRIAVITCGGVIGFKRPFDPNIANEDVALPVSLVITKAISVVQGGLLIREELRDKAETKLADQLVIKPNIDNATVATLDYGRTAHQVAGNADEEEDRDLDVEVVPYDRDDVLGEDNETGDVDEDNMNDTYDETEEDAEGLNSIVPSAMASPGNNFPNSEYHPLPPPPTPPTGAISREQAIVEEYSFETPLAVAYTSPRPVSTTTVPSDRGTGSGNDANGPNSIAVMRSPSSTIAQSLSLYGAQAHNEPGSQSQSDGLYGAQQPLFIDRVEEAVAHRIADEAKRKTGNKTGKKGTRKGGKGDKAALSGEKNPGAHRKRKPKDPKAPTTPTTGTERPQGQGRVAHVAAIQPSSNSSAGPAAEEGPSSATIIYDLTRMLCSHLVLSVAQSFPSITPSAVIMPRAAIPGERKKGLFYLQVMPPLSGPTHDRFNRHILFLIDTSVSMQRAWDKMIPSFIKSLKENLSPTNDKFNVMLFNSALFLLSPDFVPATFKNIDVTANWLRDHKLDKGTALASALKWAVRKMAEFQTSTNAIYVITDGAVESDTERTLIQYVQSSLHDTAIHTLGLGHYINRYFLSQLSASTGGYSRLAHYSDEISTELTTLMKATAQPLLTNLELVVPDDVTITNQIPHVFPNIYAGMPLFVAGGYSSMTGKTLSIVLKGDTPSGKTVSYQVALSAAKEIITSPKYSKEFLDTLDAEFGLLPPTSSSRTQTSSSQGLALRSSSTSLLSTTKTSSNSPRPSIPSIAQPSLSTFPIENEEATLLSSEATANASPSDSVSIPVAIALPAALTQPPTSVITLAQPQTSNDPPTQVDVDVTDTPDQILLSEPCLPPNSSMSLLQPQSAPDTQTPLNQSKIEETSNGRLSAHSSSSEPSIIPAKMKMSRACALIPIESIHSRLFMDVLACSTVSNPDDQRSLHLLTVLSLKEGLPTFCTRLIMFRVQDSTDKTTPSEMKLSMKLWGDFTAFANDVNHVSSDLHQWSRILHHCYGNLSLDSPANGRFLSGKTPSAPTAVGGALYTRNDLPFKTAFLSFIKPYMHSVLALVDDEIMSNGVSSSTYKFINSYSIRLPLRQLAKIRLACAVHLSTSRPLVVGAGAFLRGNTESTNMNRGIRRACSAGNFYKRPSAKEKCGLFSCLPSFMTRTPRVVAADEEFVKEKTKILRLLKKSFDNPSAVTNVASLDILLGKGNAITWEFGRS